MATSPSSGETLQIAYISDKRLKVNMSNMNSILDKVGSRPLAIISINGPMRSGKSYIINHFLRFLSNPGSEWFKKKLDNEFHWKNSSERQTTGINMWSEPFIVKRNNKEIAVLLMDTQGCFDDKTTNQENALIFALSCLLSSTLIYNVKNQLAADSLEFLQMFVSFARMSEDRSERQSYSKLIFLIRDWEVPREFSYGYYDDKTSPELKNFKKEKLDVKIDSIPENKVLRHEILSAFKDVGCHLMPHPGTGLARYDKIGKIKSDFIDGIKDFIPRVLGENIVTKKNGDKEITGDEMKNFVQFVAKTFAEATIPEIKSISEANAEYQNNSAHLIALKHYRNEMENVYRKLLDKEFNAKHDVIKAEAFEIFERMKRVHHDDIKKKYFDLLKDAINEVYKNHKQVNEIYNDYEQFKVKIEEDKKKMENEMHKMSEQINLKQEELKTMENETKKKLENFELEKENDRKKMENEMKKMREQFEFDKENDRKKIENEMHKMSEQFNLEQEEGKRMENETKKKLENFELEKENDRKKMENEMKKMCEQFEFDKENDRKKIENDMHKMSEQCNLIQEEAKRLKNEFKKKIENLEFEKEEERKKMEMEIQELKQKNDSIEQSSITKWLGFASDLCMKVFERYFK